MTDGEKQIFNMLIARIESISKGKARLELRVEELEKELLQGELDCERLHVPEP